MTFSLKTRKIGDIAILDLSGRLTIGEPVLSVREAIRQFVADGTPNVILNLGEVTHMDSAGLGELITSYTSCRNRSGQVKLLNVPKIVRDLLQITKLLTVFDCHDSETKAIESFGVKGTQGR